MDVVTPGTDVLNILLGLENEALILGLKCALASALVQFMGHLA
jgi:hypothetical protein